jgi:hypothetical protein
MCEGDKLARPLARPGLLMEVVLGFLAILLVARGGSHKGINTNCIHGSARRAAGCCSWLLPLPAARLLRGYYCPLCMHVRVVYL